MSDDLDELWREFAAETQEHLETLGWLLSERDHPHWTTDEIARVFRYFHSLKGACLAMGFGNLEALAHRAEDILSLVRDGRADLDAGLAALLLRVVDRLIDLREHVVGRRQDAEPQGDLSAEAQERHRAAHAAGGAEPVAAPAPELPLGSDPEMLAIYSEILDQRLPLLAGALAASPDMRMAAAEAATELALGAEMMGFEALATDLAALGGLAADPAERAALLALLEELRQQAALIEEITGIASGATRLAAALSDDLGGETGPGGDILAALDALAGALTGSAAEASAVAKGARAVFEAHGRDRAGRLLLLLEELSARGNWDSSDAATEWALDLVAQLRGAAEAGRDLPAEAVDAITARWQAAVAGTDARAGAGTGAGGFPLGAEVVATLSHEQRVRLDQAFADGDEHAYQLLLALESDAEIAGTLMGWLSSAVETITSRTVLRHGTSGWEFLVLSPQPIEWLRTQLEEFDPGRHCLLDLREIERSASAPAAAGRTESAPSSLLRVRSEAVDALMTEIGGMRSLLAGLREILRHGSLARAAQSLNRLTADLDPALAASLGGVFDGTVEDLEALIEIEEALERTHRQVWEAGLALRVVPIEALFARVARHVRDLAQKLDKSVDLVIEGRDVRIDKSLIDLLADPLMHIVRNALDHGIESAERRAELGKPARARLQLAAVERTHSIHITVADDGRGLDTARILAKAVERGLVAEADAATLDPREIHALIFRPGFSTAAVVSDISGRGVGLDVVASAVQSVGGTSEVGTEAGVGTRFILKLPVSAGLVRALLVRVEGETLALPERHIAGVLELEPDQIAGGTVAYGGCTLPLRHLGRLLGFPAGTPAPAAPAALARIAVLDTGTRRLGLIVDQCLRFQDLFLKEVSPLFAALPAVGGAAILGDGTPVLVLDIDGIMAQIDDRRALLCPDRR